jgi:hypothetical protein
MQERQRNFLGDFAVGTTRQKLLFPSSSLRVAHRRNLTTSNILFDIREESREEKARLKEECEFLPAVHAERK